MLLAVGCGCLLGAVGDCWLWGRGVVAVGSGGFGLCVGCVGPMGGCGGCGGLLAVGCGGCGLCGACLGCWALGLWGLWGLGVVGCGLGGALKFEMRFLNLQSQNHRFRTAKSSCAFLGV